VIDWCEKCEELMQPFLDGVLSQDEVAEAQKHLDNCTWCARRYRFEERLRHYVRVATAEPMSAELKQKLAALRTPL
jgi:anti-sigma factor RsiW